MPIVQLLITLLPTILSLIHTTEATSPGPGTGAQKQQSVLDALRAILRGFPALNSKVEPFLTLIPPIINVYVMLSNIFGWSPKVAQLAQTLGSDIQAPAPVEDAVVRPVP